MGIIKNFMIKVFNLSLVLVTVMLSCTSKKVALEETTKNEITSTKKQAKNVIFMIGDGMGVTQITSGLIENNGLNLESFQSIGFIKTNSSKELITDSAAGATAFSIGKKTYNGAVGVDENKQPQETLLETLSQDGYSTGLVATCTITHATPASFYAHQPSRKLYYEIAADMVKTTPDVFIGGGKAHFVNRTDATNGKVDDRNIIQELETKGVTFINTLSELEQAKGKVGYFVADEHPKKILEGRGDYLPNSVNPVINHLQKESKKGFFLMLEGSQIDWGGHANDSDYIISEMLDFDKAIGKVLEFAKKDGNTLVVVTADHETGGYALRAGGENNKDYSKVEGAFATGGHTGVMVPVFAYGPGAETFQGIYNNNDIYFKIKVALGVK